MIQKIVNGRIKIRTENQVLLAQFFTPIVIAEYMSTMFQKSDTQDVRILDPGAGEGILGLTLLNHINKSGSHATFVEFDKTTSETLTDNIHLSKYRETANVINADFIDTALKLERNGQKFTHIILNPPYFKLRVDSPSSKLLRQNGIKITNIYAAFVWLSAKLLDENAQLVAIIPRSFCNGPYFQSFREFLTDNFSIDSIHIFTSRNKAFAGDSVLQENIILHISNKHQAKTVRLSYSSDQTFIDIAHKAIPIESILEPGDVSKTIHIPSFDQSISLGDHISHSLLELGLMVSTGPIVDFRLKDQILANQSPDSIPLLYPAHISGHSIEWPVVSFKKKGQYYLPLTSNKEELPLGGIESVSTDKNIFPLDGYYVVVRRFSSKEEKRRIFAAVVDPKVVDSRFVTFENHLNYFHIRKHGLTKDLAYGLCAYLNSSILDEHFRKISGHTQVNVSDLKRMPYPSANKLEILGKAMQAANGLIDDIVTTEIIGKTD